MYYTFIKCGYNLKPNKVLELFDFLNKTDGHKMLDFFFFFYVVSCDSLKKTATSIT